MKWVFIDAHHVGYDEYIALLYGKNPQTYWHPLIKDVYAMAMSMCVCVYLSSGFKGQCFNYVIPIAKSYPPMTSLPYLGLVILPLRTPRGDLARRGFQLVRVSWLGFHGSCLEAVPQPRNLSYQVFITVP
jgi:hypothetical protein